MTKNYLTVKGRLGSMLFAMAALLFMGSITARADVKVVIKDFNLSQKPNSFAKVAIEVQQTDGETFVGIGGDIYLSEGLEFVDENGKQFGQSGYTGVIATKNNDRCTSNHSLTSAIRDGLQDGGIYASGHGQQLPGNPLRFALTSFNKNVKGTEGAVIYFYVKAVAPFSTNAKATITLKDAKIDSNAISEVTATVYDENRFAGLAVKDIDIFESTELKKGEADVQVYLHWSDIPATEGSGLTALQADFYLPEGLCFELDDDGDYVFNHNLNTDHVVNAQTLSDGGVRIMVYSLSNSIINAANPSSNSYTLPNGYNKSLYDYPVLNFKVIAGESIADQSFIEIKNVKGMTQASGALLINDAQILVTNLSANKISATDYSFNPGDEQEIGIILNNVSNNITALQADVILPQGLEFVADDEEEFFFMNADRVSPSHSVTSKDVTVDGASAKRVMLLSMTSDVISGTEGTLISFNVMASTALADTSYIKVVNASITNSTGRKMTLPELDIMIVNPNVAAAQEMTEAITALEAEFAAANAAVAQDYALAVEAVAEDSAAIDAAIADLKAQVADIAAAGNAASQVAQIDAKIEEIEEMIADYLEAAEAENDIAMRVIAPAVENNAEYYSLSGKRLTVPVSGQISIVKYNDGSVRKVYIE